MLCLWCEHNAQEHISYDTVFLKACGGYITFKTWIPPLVALQVGI